MRLRRGGEVLLVPCLVEVVPQWLWTGWVLGHISSAYKSPRQATPSETTLPEIPSSPTEPLYLSLERYEREREMSEIPDGIPGEGRGAAAEDSKRFHIYLSWYPGHGCPPFLAQLRQEPLRNINVSLITGRLEGAFLKKRGFTPFLGSPIIRPSAGGAIPRLV